MRVKSCAIIGSGPAALMAAEVLSSSVSPGSKVAIFEKKKGPGRKLLIAGASGLNITNAAPLSEFLKYYTGPPAFWEHVLDEFSPKDWIQFINGLGLETFEGTTGRYFVKEMKASKLLRAWLKRLSDRGVEFHFNSECIGFESDPGGIRLKFQGRESEIFDAVCFALGGASYEPQEQPLRWPAFFKANGILFSEFTPSNVGYQVEWPKELLREAEGQPLKNIVMTSSRGVRRGDAIITKYGIEGTPVYFTAETGLVHLDLKPDLTLEQILTKCLAVKENLSPFRRIKKQLGLCPAALALVFHLAPKNLQSDLSGLANMLKKFPLLLGAPQPISEAISSAGGLRLEELDENLMLKKVPGVFVAGEMLDWDAPTGGFLIQGCVSQGYVAGKGIQSWWESAK